MSDNDPQAALAAAAARIAQLEAESADLTTRLAAAETNVKSATDASAAATARASQLESDLGKATATVADLSGKLADLNAPVEPGIRRGSTIFLTDDDRSFDTLGAARHHVIALRLGVSDAAAAALVGRADELVPLIQKAASGGG